LSELQKSRQFEVSYRIHTKDGQLKWVLERGIGIENETGVLDSIEGFIIDITDQKQRETEMSAIASISYDLRTVKNKSEMLPIILNQTVELLHADGGTIELIDNKTGDAVVMYAIGLYSFLTGKHIPIQEGLERLVRSGGKTIHFNLVSTIDPPLSQEYRNICRSIAGAPLMVQGNLIGSLWIGSNTDIPESIMNTLSSIADIAANAINRAELASQTEQRLRRLISLRKIDSAINGNQEIGFTLNLLLEQTVDQLRVDAADILLLKTDNSISFESGVGFNTPPVSNLNLTQGDGLVRQSILGRRTIAIQNIHQLKEEDECKNRVLAAGYKGYFIVPLIAKNDVVGIMEAFTVIAFSPDQDWIEFFETLAGQAAIAYSDSRLVSDLQKSNFELQQAYDETIAGWSSALDLRDKETEGHSQRVTRITLDLARRMGINGEDLVNVKRGSLLHDIGKMGVPDYILLKPSKLTDDEWKIMRMHPINAYQILSSIKYLTPALEIPYCHHEKWDGSGYPRGLKGKDIPLSARIFCLVDVWDALTSDRPYRAAISHKEALDYIAAESGIHFDPELVQIVLDYFSEHPHEAA
jgi:HD-GYP domain-containing protein (c-di-GMP phosphodiesterase class II)